MFSSWLCNVTMYSTVIRTASELVRYLRQMCESTVLRHSWKYKRCSCRLATTFDLAVTTYMVVAAENAGNVKGLPTHFLHSSLVPFP